VIRKKILHVVNVSFVIPYFLGEQINYFNSKNFEIHVACTPDSNIVKFGKCWQFKFLPLEVTRKFSFLKDFLSLLKLILYIKKHNFDYVVGHTPKGALLASISSYINRTERRFYFRHGLMYETSVGFKRYILILIEKLTSCLATDVICVSKSVLNKSIEYNLSAFKKLKIINQGTCNGVDTENKFNKKNINNGRYLLLKKALNINDGDFIVGYIGRVSKDKGIDFLVEAWFKFLEFNSQVNNFKLVICGPIDSRDSISTRTFDLINNESSIIHVGEVSDTEYYYNLFNVFVLPSLREGFPTVVLEASAMELPIITTKSTGCIDSIIENKTGMFISIDSVDILNKIQFYYDKPKLAHNHGINGRNFVIQNFSQKIFYEHLLKNLYS
jgi:glycosyltransferase involved in cell wall biosynthesis